MKDLAGTRNGGGVNDVPYRVDRVGGDGPERKAVQLPALSEQTSFWNGWNRDHREAERTQVSLDQARVILGWMQELGRKNLRILEVGCGTGWFCPQLSAYGQVTGTDLSDAVLGRARERWPAIRFVAGDFMTLDFPEGTFDVIVTLEVLSHVADQDMFLERIRSLLRPGGILMLATQNRPVLQGHCHVPPPAAGQIRRWVDRRELAELAGRKLHIDLISSVTPAATKGIRRLVTSSRFGAIHWPLVGPHVRRFAESRHWGWTLMLKASRRN